mmetsp:Transcript_13366/g.11865  ORF Transcript_13366/g.11865 Transcript_13366/m.11865 type:complete len:242 (+) Transcript_13366:744-1469(+)
MNSEINSEVKILSGHCLYKTLTSNEELISHLSTDYSNFIIHLLYLLELKEFEVSKLSLKICCLLCENDKNITLLLKHGFLNYFDEINQKCKIKALFNISLSYDNNKEILTTDKNILIKLVGLYDTYITPKPLILVTGIFINLAVSKCVDALMYCIQSGLMFKVKYLLEKDSKIEIQESLLNLIIELIGLIPEEVEDHILEYGLGEIIEQIWEEVNNNEIEALCLSIFDSIEDRIENTVSID